MIIAQSDHIKEIAKYGLQYDQENLLQAINQLIEHSKQSKRVNFDLQLQSILKESIQQSRIGVLRKTNSSSSNLPLHDPEIKDFILEKITSDYSLDDLITSDINKEELQYFIKEHLALDVLKNYELPVANKIFFYGPSGCGKTLASYVLAGELEKMMIVVNLGSIVSSKLGETSKNLSRVFKSATAENAIIFLDEFDTLGKVRDYYQDHGEMKRVVNTLLQLFDYLPQDSIVIAASNHEKMIDQALLRRFDLKLKLDLPNKTQIENLINKTLKSGFFRLNEESELDNIISLSEGLSYFSVQRSLVNAIKRTLLDFDNAETEKVLTIDKAIWIQLLQKEKQNQ